MRSGWLILIALLTGCGYTGLISTQDHPWARSPTFEASNDSPALSDYRADQGIEPVKASQEQTPPAHEPARIIQKPNTTPEKPTPSPQPIARVRPSDGLRYALIIGNSRYQNIETLGATPLNDADDMAATLTHIGFKVIKRKNLTHQAMEEVLLAFQQQLKRAELGLFYYAGHAIQVNNINYLLPVDILAGSEGQIKHKALSLDLILDTVQDSGVKLKIAILDSCRDNPFRNFRSISRGLARANAPSGTLIAYATAPGDVASNNNAGRNGFYTQYLLDYIRQYSNRDIRHLFDDIAWEVSQASKGNQQPWVSKSPFPPYCLSGC